MKPYNPVMDLGAAVGFAIGGPLVVPLVNLADGLKDEFEREGPYLMTRNFWEQGGRMISAVSAVYETFLGLPPYLTGRGLRAGGRGIIHLSEKVMSKTKGYVFNSI